MRDSNQTPCDEGVQGDRGTLQPRVRPVRFQQHPGRPQYRNPGTAEPRELWEMHKASQQALQAEAKESHLPDSALRRETHQRQILHRCSRLL